MKKRYLNPSLRIAEVLLDHNINVNSIQGDGVGYGGGADPSTGRVKGRDGYDEEEFIEEDVTSNGLW